MTKITQTKFSRKKKEGGFKPDEGRVMQVFTYSNGKKIQVWVAKGQIINPLKLYKKHFPNQWS